MDLIYSDNYISIFKEKELYQIIMYSNYNLVDEFEVRKEDIIVSIQNKIRIFEEKNKSIQKKLKISSIEPYFNQYDINAISDAIFKKEL